MIKILFRTRLALTTLVLLVNRLGSMLAKWIGIVLVLLAIAKAMALSLLCIREFVLISFFR